MKAKHVGINSRTGKGARPSGPCMARNKFDFVRAGALKEGFNNFERIVIAGRQIGISCERDVVGIKQAFTCGMSCDCPTLIVRF